MDANQIKFIKLVNGEELLGEVLPVPEEGVVVKNPVIFVGTPTGQIAIRPWLPMTDTDQEYHIRRLMIAGIYEPQIEIRRSYEQMFNGGIVTPTPEEVNRINHTKGGILLE